MQSTAIYNRVSIVFQRHETAEKQWYEFCMKNEHPNVMICPDSNEQMALSNNEKTKKSKLSEGSRFLKLVTTLIKIFQTTGVLPSAQQTEDIRFVFVKKQILNFY